MPWLAFCTDPLLKYFKVLRVFVPEAVSYCTFYAEEQSGSAIHVTASLLILEVPTLLKLSVHPRVCPLSFICCFDF